ncbi:MAG: alpha/beta hydrolase [Paracoccaceae bacterium]
MPDYSKLLDAEMLAYIALCDSLYPTDAVDLDISGQRRVYDHMCAHFDGSIPDGVHVQDRAFGAVPCRIYTPLTCDGTVVYYHGGGFVVGGLHSHNSICADIADAAGLRVVAVDYPLSPEHPYPEDFNAAWSAYCAVVKTFEGPIVVCGDSAGGNLAAAVSHQARAIGNLPLGQVLIYPGLGGDLDLPSYHEHAHAPQLTRADIEFYMTIRYRGAVPVGDPLSAPLQDTDFSGLPPTVAVSAQCDPLSSDGDAYVQKIQSAGGQASWINEPGLVHGYLRARRMSTRAQASFARICAALKQVAQGRWDMA